MSAVYGDMSEQELQVALSVAATTDSMEEFSHEL
jgi:hypothetical protein